MNDKIGFAVFGGIGGLCLLIGIVLLTFAIRGIQEQQRYFLMSGILLSIGTFFAIASVFILLGRVTGMQFPGQEAIPGMER